VKRPQNAVQQALIGLLVMIAVVGTIIGGVILALGDRARIEADVERPTATTFRIVTIPSSITTARPTPTHVPTVLPTIVTIPTTTPRPAAPTLTATAKQAQPTILPSATTTLCTPQAGWVSYVVQPGDTIFLIGLRYGVTTTRMRSANCLTGDRIEVGDLLRVPPVTPSSGGRASVTPTGEGISFPTSTVGPTGTQTATDGACTDPDSVITFPHVGAVLHGLVEFRGTARIPDFSFYKLEIRRNDGSTAANYVTFFMGKQQVTNDVLAQLNTTEYSDGEYWIRLVVVNSTGNYPERCAILFPFDN